MPRKILVAYDFSTIADRALTWAAELARETSGVITLIHVQVLTPPTMAPDAVIPIPSITPEETRELETRLREVAARHGVTGGVEVRLGVNVGASVVERAREMGADLIVAGTHGRGALARAVLGSVADHVVRHAHCPVVTIREPHGT